MLGADFMVKSSGFHEIWWISGMKSADFMLSADFMVNPVDLMKSGRFHAQCGFHGEIQQSLWKKQISKCKIFKTLLLTYGNQINDSF